MYLFKHPKELRPNKDMAGRLINEWSRPIFGQSSNFKSVNREDLQKRDMESMKKRRRRYNNIRVLIGWGCFMVMELVCRLIVSVLVGSAFRSSKPAS